MNVPSSKGSAIPAIPAGARGTARGPPRNPTRFPHRTRFAPRPPFPRLISCGATTGFDVGLDLRALFAKQLSLFGSYVGTKGELLRVAPFFFAGELSPIIDRTFPLVQAGDAQRRLEASEHFGKIVLVA